jgi:hypothetical protein
MVEIKKLRLGLHDKNFNGLFASRDIDAGKIILILKGNHFKKPTRTSIQIGLEKHLEHYEGGYMNHHCDPSAEVVVNSRQHAGLGTIEPLVLAKRDIVKGEEITFDYESTEEVMAEPFDCNCHGRLIEGWNAFRRI